MKNIFITLTALLATLFTTAQEVENALLWKLEGKGLETSYIFGTMHVLCDATLAPQVEMALELTQVVVLEIDMDNPRLQAEMMQNMMLPPGESISKYLTSEERITLDAFLNTYIKSPLVVVDKMAPLMVESLLIPATLDCPMQSIETNLMAHAQKEQEEVLGLESVKEQFDAFNRIPLKEQALALFKKANAGVEQDRVLFKKMQQAYMQHDLNGLMKIMNEESSEFMANGEELLDKRNKNWIPRIITISEKQAAFYGVGAAHLAGERGVIKLLRAQGYNVTPVFIN